MDLDFSHVLRFCVVVLQPRFQEAQLIPRWGWKLYVLEKRAICFRGLLTLLGGSSTIEKSGEEVLTLNEMKDWKAKKKKQKTGHFQDFFYWGTTTKRLLTVQDTTENVVSQHSNIMNCSFILWANLAAVVETTSRQAKRDDLFCCWKLHSTQKLRPLRIKPRLMNFGLSIINYSSEARSYKKKKKGGEIQPYIKRKGWCRSAFFIIQMFILGWHSWWLH